MYDGVSLELEPFRDPEPYFELESSLVKKDVCIIGTTSRGVVRC